MAESKFFCENCGAEVRHNTKICPKCGRFFSAVRCPKCAFTGDAALFRQGCPSCGYAGSWRDSAGQGDFTVVEEFRESDRKRARSRGRHERYRRDTPAWVYWLAMAILGIAFVILVIVYMNL
jgi:predicted RNA-binding Zn-ribbon protein involved in translation (DUF1610 family)